MGPLPFYLLALSLLYNAPLIVVLWIARNRIAPSIARGLAALGFASATAYTLWRLEWFDVWRHGVPPLSYLVTTFVPYLGIFAVLGWLTADRLSRGHR